MSFEGLLSLQKREPQLAVREPSLGEELAETARETFEFNPVQAIQRQEDLAAANRSTNILSAEAARSRLRNANFDTQLTVPDQGITQEALDILIQRKQIENKRAELYSRSPGGFGRGAARLAVGFGVSLFDPINIASGFVPVISQARYASLLRARAGVGGRTAVRAGVGVAEGVAGAALIEPIILSAARAEQADYDASDSLLNIAFGAAIGGGLHVLGGSLSEAYRRSQGLPPLPPERQIDAAVRQAIEADQALPPIGEVEAAARALDPDDVVIARNREALIARAADAPVASREQLLRELDDANAALARVTDQAGSTMPLDARIAQIEERLRNEDIAVFGPDQVDSRQVQRLRQRTARKQAEAELRREEDSSLDLQIDSKARAERASRELLRLMSAKEARRLLDKIEANKPLSANEMATLREIDALTMPGSARNIAEQVLPETRRAALSTGVAQAMQSRSINVEPIVNLDPSQRQNAPVDPMVSARNAAIENARPDQATMVDFDAAAETPDPRAVPMLDAAAQSLDEAVAAADEAIAAVNAEGQYRRNLLVQEEGFAYGGNRRLALRELHKKSDIKFVDFTIDRGGAHTPAKPNSGSPAYDVALNGTYPEDFYGPNGLRYYSTGYSKMDSEVYGHLQRVAGRPNHFITIYRAVEKDGPNKIMPGDWVTPSRAYAKDHGESALDGKFKILKMRAHARDIYTSGDSMLEWGYHPQESMPEIRATAPAEAAITQINPATFSANEGLQRYLAEGPVRSQAGPGAVAAQRQAVRAVEDLRSTDSILALALSDQYSERQRVSLVGQKVADHADLAVLAQVYRDPRFETLRYFFVDRNDNIIAQAGLTSRLPSSAAAIIGDDPQGFYGELVQRAIFLGAKGVYLLHNHPSTNPTASVADIDVTRVVSQFTKKMGVELKGHVIIDTNQYTVIDADGNARTIDKDFGQADPKKLMDIGGKPLTNPDVLVNIAKQIEVDEDAVVVAVVNAQLKVQNLAVLPSEQLRKGTVAAKSALMRTALEARGEFLFAIGKNMETLDAIQSFVVDRVFVSPDGRYVTSGNAAMRSLFPKDRRVRASADTSPAFDYLRQISLQDAKRMRGVAEEGGVYEAPDTNAELRPFNDAIQRADIYARAVRAAAERIGNDDAARSAMQAATNNQLGAYEIDALLEKLKLENQTVRSRLRKAKAQFTADETADALQSDAMRAANAVANNVKLDATIAARNAALSLAARTKIVGRVITEFAQNPKEGILAVLGGSSFAKFGSKDSAFHWQRTYFTRWTKGMLAELEQAGVGEAFMSNAYARDVARALYQLGRENPRLEGLAGEAVTIAKIVYKYREDSRNTRNRFGAWIRDLTGYITRQQHDFTKIRTAGAEEWKAFVRQRLDIDRTLEPGQNLEEFLDVVYSDFAAGRQMASVDDEAAAYTTPGSLARRASQSRVLYFLDADAEFDYLEKFGAGKLNEAVLGDLSRAAQQAGLMRILGPNPEYTLKAAMAEIDASLRGNAELREQFADAVDTANELLTMLDGRANIPGSQISARVGSNIRVVQAMSKLGGAVISAVTDLPVYASQIRYQGRGGLLAGIGEGISNLLQGRAKGERKQILNMIDTVSENVVGGVAMRFDSDDVMSATSADLMRIFFRLNGLAWWTDTLREGMEIGTANWLGNLRNTAFDAVGAESKNVLQQYGIAAPEWDVLRQAFVSDSKGKFYVVPEAVTRLSPDVIRQYLATIGRSTSDTAIANARRDLSDRLRNLIIDQAMTAVIEPDVRSRYFWTRGTKPGTFWGEIARYVAQFKGFPTALTRQVFGREIYGRGYNSLGEYLKYGKGDMLGLAQLILAMTAFGYIAMAAKDLLKAKTPRDPTEPQTWIAAMLQGGALGIYGDFLLGQSNRFGRNIVDTLVGPTFGVLGDLDELRQRAMRGDDVASSAFRMLIANTPFMNLFYTRIVLDYLILYQIQEALDPGALRRMERRVEREQNQEFLLAPSEVVE